ncbi:hypothetical protein RND81_02G232300 [Saponaria officinalis]|uniref:Reverse transcriptase zinc-binding domain-containing protein n=1 Tax=Saponaria officinalis TaxID=3572 RepID=A0AAW1MSU8_SAPOF
MNIFLLPKGVVQRIDSICRNYLWDGSSDYMRVPMVSWDRVCCPKDEGGLGIRYSVTWNVAMVGKLVWWVYSKPNSLWVKWIHQVYLKGVSWQVYQPKLHLGGNWKDICRVKELLKVGYRDNVWLANVKGYEVGSGYEWLRKKEQKVGWTKLVWNSWCIPKHNFLNWLMLKECLPVRDRLCRHVIIDEDVCCICMNVSETVKHLFRECSYVRLLLDKAAERLHIPRPSGNALIWIGRRKWSRAKTMVCLFVFLAVHYNVWQQRNRVRLEGVIARPDCIVEQIIQMLKVRVWQTRLQLNTDEIGWYSQIV